MFSIPSAFGGATVYVLGYQGQDFVIPLLSVLVTFGVTMLLIFLFFLGR